MVVLKNCWKTVCLFLLIFVLFFIMPTTSMAEEMADPARKASLNEFFSKQVCNDCHGATPKYNIRSARTQYDVSGHKNNGNSFYSNGANCQKCHTHEGFVEYVETGKVDEKSYIKAPSQPACFTCHDPHVNADLSLRTVAPVTLVSGKKFDIGEGNLCANCHSAVSGTDIVKEMEAVKLASYWGPHHGPQADMLIGTNGYEFPGKTYYSSVHSTLTKNGCVECHMTFPDARFSFSPELAGHSFNVAAEVHEAPKLNNSGCLGNCHAKVGQVTAVNPETPVETFFWHQTPAVFDIEAKADFDNDGKVEPLQAEIEGLLNLFVNTKGTGYFQKGELPMYKKDGNWNWTRSKQIRPLKEVAAFYNYKFILEDRSRGIHNAPYTIQLLYDSIEALDPDFDTSKRNIYKPPEEYKPPKPEA